MLSSSRDVGKHLSFCLVSWSTGTATNSTLDFELLLEFLFELFFDWSLDTALEVCFDVDLEFILLDFLILPCMDLFILLKKHLFASGFLGSIGSSISSSSSLESSSFNLVLLRTSFSKIVHLSSDNFSLSFNC